MADDLLAATTLEPPTRSTEPPRPPAASAGTTLAPQAPLPSPGPSTPVPDVDAAAPPKRFDTVGLFALLAGVAVPLIATIGIGHRAAPFLPPTAIALGLVAHIQARREGSSSLWGTAGIFLGLLWTFWIFVLFGLGVVITYTLLPLLA